MRLRSESRMEYTNKVVLITGAGSGIGRVTAHAFAKEGAKIVVSDIDGTISKSDVLGHLMPMVGRDWSHEGVASLYANIAKNGYQIVYLTSRAIGQTGQTKGYLESIVQDDVSLPKGTYRRKMQNNAEI